MLVEQVPLEFRGLIPHEPEPIFKYSSEEDNSECWLPCGLSSFDADVQLLRLSPN